MQESNYHGNQEKFNICKCPLIKAKIQGIATLILVDTGSEVTCISEEFFENNKKVFEEYARLPITGKKVRVAIGNKTTVIKWQIICTLQITDAIEHMIFLIIPGLTKNCILGYDGQKELKIALFPASDLMSYNNKEIKFNSPLEKNTNIREITSDHNNVSGTHNEHRCVDHTISLYDLSEAPENEIPSINLLETDDNNIVFEEEVNFHNNEVTMEKINEKIMFNQK